ncbi:hypothetical protein TURU_056397 [Turdus rufiventris]|nr:hypothetical protein TURU_056397 [Turdus rufiventris]
MERPRRGGRGEEGKEKDREEEEKERKEKEKEKEGGRLRLRCSSCSCAAVPQPRVAPAPRGIALAEDARRNMSNHPDCEHFFSKKETRISKSLLGEIKNE